MNEQGNSAMRVAFEAILDASAEPQLPNVTDAVVRGGRRIRRRRTTISAATALVVAALAVTAAVHLPGTDADRHPAPPLGTVDSPAPTPPPSPSPSPPSTPTPVTAPANPAGVPSPAW
ncbi:hypothetical protein [Streptomyces sp. A 4/2]|uniref:hypothetical protein n=1 Tax=Streptomyces sp. A 4/2 TaxID=2934314 RepID=UPI002024BB75|nr:hypothetical protein [Streptomyces sp. A 4/2]